MLTLGWNSWFTYAPLIKAITRRGLDVIGMVKATNQRYLHNGKAILALKRVHFKPFIPISRRYCACGKSICSTR